MYFALDSKQNWRDSIQISFSLYLVWEKRAYRGGELSRKIFSYIFESSPQIYSLLNLKAVKELFMLYMFIRENCLAIFFLSLY